jgi:hypothetical protein
VGGGDRGGGCGGSRRCRGVFGGALGLELSGVEDAVTAVGAYGERLGVVFKGVGRGLRTLVDDGQLAALLEQVEGGVSADTMDAARGYVSGYAEVADEGFVTHALELADGDVVALVIPGAAEGEVGDGGEDDHGGNDDFSWAFLGICHGVWLSSPVLRCVPHPLSKVCKVFKGDTLSLDFGLPAFKGPDPAC